MPWISTSSSGSHSRVTPTAAMAGYSVPASRRQTAPISLAVRLVVLDVGQVDGQASGSDGWPPAAAGAVSRLVSARSNCGTTPPGHVPVPVHAGLAGQEHHPAGRGRETACESRRAGRAPRG